SLPKRWPMLSALPVRRLSIAMTSYPRSRKSSHRCEPRNPAPPVIRTRTFPPLCWDPRRGSLLVEGHLAGELVLVLLEDEIDALADVLGDGDFGLRVELLELFVLFRSDVDGRRDLLAAHPRAP